MSNVEKKAAKVSRHLDKLSVVYKKRIMSMTALNDMTEAQWREAWRKLWRRRLQSSPNLKKIASKSRETHL